MKLPDIRAGASASQHVPPIRSSVAQQAVEWLLALQAQPACTALQQRWQAWLEQDAEHRQAWDRIQGMNDKMRGLANPVDAAIAHATLEHGIALPRRQLNKLLGALLLLGGSAWILREQGVLQRWGADYRTQVGASQAVALDDGSIIRLNTATAIDVRYTASERRIRLIEGEIMVVTAKDAARRPFLVETVHGEAQALGTEYQVYLRDGATRVAVYAGAVRLTPRGAPDQPVLLQAGQSALLAATLVSTPLAADRDEVAWTDHYIVAKGMRLASFLAELNRYSATQASCAPALRDSRISGSYPLADIDKVLETVAATLGARLERIERRWQLHDEVRLLPA